MGVCVKISPSQTSKPVIFLYKFVLFRENTAVLFIFFLFLFLDHRLTKLIK